MSCAHPELDTCGCCAAPPIFERGNRPGLGEIDYRLGSHSSFLRDLQHRLSLETVDAGPHAGSRPLAALGTRDPADPSIALLDAAATMLDVVTFYNERLANEGFLATATERLSVLQLARAIGYELGAGVAADVTLVFALAETPGTAPAHAHIPVGTRAQSLPTGGALPQTFETVVDFTAHREWNTLRPRVHRPQTLLVAEGGGIERLDVDGVPGPTDEIVLAGASLSVGTGDLLVVHIDAGTTILRVTAVAEDRDMAVTRLTVQEPPGAVADDPLPPSSGPTLTPPGPGPTPMTADAVAAVLATAYPESELMVLLADLGWDAAAFLDAAAPTAPTPVPLPFGGVFVLRRTTGLFGHNAQPYEALPIAQREGQWHTISDGGVAKSEFFDPFYPTSWESNTVWEDAHGSAYTEADLYLARDVDEVGDTGWVVLDGEVAGARTLRAYRIDERRTTSRADYGLSGQCTALEVSNPGFGGPTKSSFPLRSTVAHVASEWLPLADVQIDTPVAEDAVVLDRMVLGLTPGQAVVVTGALSDPQGVTGVEVATLLGVVHHQGRTTLTFSGPLTGSYVRSTVTVHANAVRATHGETVAQPLGGGDGAVANQSFALRRSPLTYVSAATPAGAAPTLDVRVNGRRWEEVRSLYGAGPAEQIYTVRIADDSTATVTFGDGLAGARPPTGAENITATYRTGTGPDGEVDAGAIQLLMTRPPGVATVSNPLPASGAQAPETLATARTNAPMTVRTLERVVSLTDFEDFAATFAGIGKARADVLRLDGAQLVHLTVGSASGGAVAADKLMLLRDAIDAVRDPGAALCVASHRQLPFDVTGSVRTDPALERDVVVAAALDAVVTAFSFAARRFAQGVSVAELMAVLHGVEGVVAVDIDMVAVADDVQRTVAVPPLGVLGAQPARVIEGATHLGCATVEPAELLLVNPGGIELGVMA